MAISYRVFEGTLGTSTGNHDVTLAGWTETPVAAMVYITGATALNSITPHARLCSVLIDGSASVSTAVMARDGDASSGVRGYSDNAGVTLLTTGLVVEAIGTASLITGGVRFNWPSFPPLAAYKVYVVAWAGDLTARVGIDSVSASIATNIQHAVGVPSEAVIMQGYFGSAAGSSTINNTHVGFWCNASASQASQNQNVRNARVVGDPQARAMNTQIVRDVFATLNLPGWTCSQQANGFTLTPSPTGATALLMASLSLNFSGSGDPVDCHVGTIQTPNSTGPTSQSETAPGFEPGLVMLGMGMTDTFGTLFQDGRAGAIGAGAFTIDDEFSYCTTDENNAPTTNTSCLIDQVAGRCLAHDQNPGVSAAFNAMLSNGFTLDYTSGASWLQRDWLYIAFENIEAVVFPVAAVFKPKRRQVHRNLFRPKRAFLPIFTPQDYDVCTSGNWSATINFAACDTLSLELDGPATNDIKASVTLELEET